MYTYWLARQRCVLFIFGTIYVYTCELFPTSIRSVSLGACSLAARLGGIACPFAVSIGNFFRPNDKNPEFLFYAVSALSASVVAIFLAETLNQPLYDNIKDLETSRLKNNFTMKTLIEDGEVNDTTRLLANDDDD